MAWGDDGPKRAELTAAGGTWSGLLFENQTTGFPLSLVWALTFDFAEVERDFGATEPNLCVDWVPIQGASWSAMEGLTASASKSAEPIESSVCFFEHHRFDSASVRVLEQIGPRIRVAADVKGDVDDLGLNRIVVEDWLDFDGIYVQPETKPSTVEAARDLLASFTDAAGLHGVDRPHNSLFRPLGEDVPDA